MADAMDLCPSTLDNPLKRPLPSQDGSPTSTAQSNQQSEMPTPPLTASPNHRCPSPAPSDSTLSSVTTSNKDKADGPSAPLQKRRKLTSTEKEQLRAEKEQKKREKEEQKVKRDEEKRVKDEEKRRKKEEKEAKDREKDLEKQRKENEKLKKERAQTKLTFFAKPKLPGTTSTASQPKSPADEPNTAVDTGRRKSLSVEPGEAPVLLPQSTPRERTKRTDYERKFLPFQLPSYTVCAPYISHPLQDTEVSQREFDSLLEDRASLRKASANSFFSANQGRSRGLWQPNAREVMDSLNGSSQNPIDLTDEFGGTYRPEDLLQHVTIRHLHFAEDVRPPYSGSYTKTLSPRSSAKLRKNPFSRVRKDTNYDYDSEAEWEEPEEGEDLLSDGEDDEESVGTPDEMDDFLDEDEGGPKRRLITGDLKPVSTGICWGTSAPEEPSVDLDSMKIEFFLDLPKATINPFSTAYWPTEGSSAAVPDTKPVLLLENGKIMSPRLPLQPRQSTNGVGIVGAASGMKGPIMVLGPSKAAKPASKPLDGEDLNEFREAVEGSNAPKGRLLKALKERFPKHTNDTIKSTLTECFTFFGSSRAEKKWEFVD